MPFYISKFTGAGTFEDPFRPIAADATAGRWAAIDLRADDTQLAGWAVVWTADVLSPLPTGVLLVAGSPDDVPGAAVRNAIKAELDVTVNSSTTFRAILRQFMTSEARVDGSRWRPLVPDAGGRLRVFLGDYADDWVG